MNHLVQETARKLFGIEKPLAITMWDFSWIERRWSGAGFEDWDKALEELVERGYNAVRIEAYPQLAARDIHKEWTLIPVWNTQTWGSPAVNRINLEKDFREFLKACRRHHVKVALSSWFREDEDNIRMQIKSPADHADVWIRTLDYIKEWGELDNILYVDLCNEYPLDLWIPFLGGDCNTRRTDKKALDWMRETFSLFKRAYPNIPTTFSYTVPYPDVNEDVSFLDFLEVHIWMAQVSDFYDKVGYNYERFSDVGYTNMALKGEKLYKGNEQHYKQCLEKGIKKLAQWSINSEKPLITTECWSVVDYKDGPLLNWDWVLDLNRFGVEVAAKTGCWAGIATSNFCAPQFVGMWREVEWHKEMTQLIHDSWNQ